MKFADMTAVLSLDGAAHVSKITSHFLASSSGKASEGQADRNRGEFTETPGGSTHRHGAQ